VVALSIGVAALPSASLVMMVVILNHSQPEGLRIFFNRLFTEMRTFPDIRKTTMIILYFSFLVI